MLQLYKKGIPHNNLIPKIILISGATGVLSEFTYAYHASSARLLNMTPQTTLSHLCPGKKKPSFESELTVKIFVIYIEKLDYLIICVNLLKKVNVYLFIRQGARI